MNLTLTPQLQTQPIVPHPGGMPHGNPGTRKRSGRVPGHAPKKRRKRPGGRATTLAYLTLKQSARVRGDVRTGTEKDLN